MPRSGKKAAQAGDVRSSPAFINPDKGEQTQNDLKIIF